jgi:hypothetical protein
MTIEWMAVFADVPPRDVRAAAQFWQEVTACTAGAPVGERGEFVPLIGAGEGPYFWVQRVDREDRDVGWHLDLLVDDLDATVRAARSLGASVSSEAAGLTVLASPGGLPFCVVVNGSGARRTAEPRRWTTGHRSLLDQLCLDLPPAEHDDETWFWRELTGWPVAHGALPEFERLITPPGLPLRILVQRLGADDAGPVRAHVDLASDDRAEEQRRHERLGATVVRDTEEWTTLRDPVGLIYCITDRTPAKL